jgi:AcrR family transcriptional regulator
MTRIIVDEIQSTCGKKRRYSRISPPSPDNGSRRLSHEERQRLHILKVAEEQFAATGFGSTTTAGIAKLAGIPEAVLLPYFGTKQRLFEEVVERNSRGRQAALEGRFSSIPNLPPVELFESMAEATVLACVEEIGNASIMVWGLMEMPEFAAEIYRAEIGMNEALWNVAGGKCLEKSALWTRVAVHLVPYGVHACMAFGLWLATLHHTPETAQPHARQYADGIAHVARAVLNLPADSLQAAVSRMLRVEREFAECSSATK